MMDEQKPNLRKQLAEEVQQSPWHFLKPHAERDGIIVVNRDLELLDVSFAIVSNDAPCVEKWIASGQVVKPSREQLDRWNQQPEKEFLFLIAQPWVVIQEVTH
jgi:hypothetical protein